MNEKRLHWEIFIDGSGTKNEKIVEAYNRDEDLVGWLQYERVGAHMHWCWYQEQDVRMSPGCLEEVREKQKELLNGHRK